ncbi:MAG TPA: cupredoxin domain-containing protein [Anaerolineae bacterium]|nr:cupredoxin domain-containing protein [Anaerolineae bacterium]HMR67868.1 cupredoxin domain-containing protein [Anaerolineae bacterium]
MKFKLFAVLAVLGTMFLAACGGGGGAAEPAAQAPAAAQPASIAVVMHDIYYGETNDNAQTPPTWTVPANAEITVNMDNKGVLEHNWAVVKQGEEVPEPFVEADNAGVILEDTGLVPGGQTTSAQIPALLPGEYKVICTVVGHYPLMQGRLVVTE